MAVPARRDGMNSDDEDEAPEGLFEEEGGLAGLDDGTPLHLRALVEAADAGDINALRAALDNLNGSIDEPLEDGDSALHLTCLYGHLACVQLLLERGASLEVKDEDGAIPLHDACAGGYAEIVQLLINHARSVEFVKWMLDTVDIEGDTPLHHAARGEHVDVVRILLAAGASPTRTNVFGKIPAELTEPETETRRLLEAAANAMSS